MGEKNQQSLGQTKKCPKCGEEIQASAIKCKYCGSDLRNWLVRHKIITGILILFIVGIIISMGGDENEKAVKKDNNTKVSVNQTKKQKEVKNKEDDKKIIEVTKKTQKKVEDKTKKVPVEYKSALSKAISYANVMHMSKKGVYDQLVSEYGEKFKIAAAQYAIDNVKADWNANALAKAKTYQDTMHMSPAAIYDQLVSINGEKFTKAEAKYAVKHLNDQ